MSLRENGAGREVPSAADMGIMSRDQFAEAASQDPETYKVPELRFSGTQAALERAYRRYINNQFRGGE